VEIGAGPGTWTSRFLQKGDRVIAYEVDERYRPVLDGLAETGDLETKWQNFLDAPNEEIDVLGKYYIIGNIPFHISEPLLLKLSQLKFESAILLIGSRLAGTITTNNPDANFWSRLSLVAGAYFKVEPIEEVPKTSFDPPPRVNGILVRITRNDKDAAWKSDGLVRSYRALIEANKTHSTAAKALKTVFIDRQGRAQSRVGKNKDASNHKAQRKIVKLALKEFSNEYVPDATGAADQGGVAQSQVELNIPQSVYSLIHSRVNEKLLSRPLSGLDNNGLRQICSAISAAINRLTQA
jgi:16S rRNA (adenine1518-N6/adenine1519-N6)-dimethyltransferase